MVDSFTKNNILTLLALCNAISKPIAFAISYSIPPVSERPAVSTIVKFLFSKTLTTLVSDFSVWPILNPSIGSFATNLIN